MAQQNEIQISPQNMGLMSQLFNEFAVFSKRLADILSDNAAAGGVSVPTSSPRKKRKQSKPVSEDKEHNIKGVKHSYMFFMAENRKHYQEQFPDLNFADLSKKMGEIWATLPKAQKDRYEALAAQDKIRYDEERKAAGLSLKMSKKDKSAQQAAKPPQRYAPAVTPEFEGDDATEEEASDDEPAPALKASAKAKSSSSSKAAPAPVKTPVKAAATSFAAEAAPPKSKKPKTGKQ